MKKSRISIRWKTFIIFLIFAIVLIGVLWLFQIVYLNDFYRMIKTQETEAVMSDVEQILLSSDEDDSEEIEAIAASHNIGLIVADPDGNCLYAAEYILNSRLSTMPDYIFSLFYDSAVANGGSAVIEYKGGVMQNENAPMILNEYIENGSDVPDEEGEDAVATPTLNIDGTDEAGESEEQVDAEDSVANQGSGRVAYTIPPDDVGDVDGDDDQHFEQFRQNIGNDMAESVIYIKIINDCGEEKVIMINSVLTPVDATVSTLKAQLIIISLLMVVVAFILAMINSTSISRSIIKLKDGAKKLAAGDYTVKFNSIDYLEVAELSDTLNYAATELEKTDSLQKELIANVSHDLRTPLTMIKGYAEVMRDIPGENTPENVQVIIEETERLSGLVNDMLDISKLKAGTITLQPEEYNITESIRHVLERYNKLREVEGYTIDFLYDSEVTVYADEQKMYQVLYNLVNNAINYTGEDKKVTVKQIVNEGTLRIEVIDTGDGVKQEDIPYVWDRYYKDKTTHKRALQGTGLGLSIVKNVLELHGAKYGVSSIQGKGATFWFELPLN